MAIHKKLPVGSILFTYHEPGYNYSNHRYGRGKYHIDFKVLYVHNRRERTTGASVPRTLIPTLEKLGIRHQEYSYDQQQTSAIGCRTYKYYSFSSNSPYPTAEAIQTAQQELESLFTRETVSVEGIRISLVENDFMKDFKEKKMKNKDAIFSLSKPLHDYLANETYITNQNTWR
ncbi:hypothetical protein ACFX4N_24210 [Priestia sp. YIM B13551]|uniref:hypothetical protein n=1 Tax=Priestia sp. YIM B13551 TaxID=3366306 RepID=UPI00366DAA1C